MAPFATISATPLDMKAEANRIFSGVIIGWTWILTPENAEYPGWRFYAAGFLMKESSGS